MQGLSSTATFEAATTTVVAAEPAVERTLSTKTKKSLPNIFVLPREKSQRSLRAKASPPQTAAFHGSFKPHPSVVPPTGDQDVPAVPSRQPSLIRARIAEAKRRRDEQIQNVIDVSKTSSRPPSDTGNNPSDANPRPSFSQRRLHTDPSDEHISSKALGIATARPSIDSQSLVQPPPTATFSKTTPIYRPSQGEMENFDFKLPQRPHTATVAPAQLSPKHDSTVSARLVTRPRQVSDAESSWQKSPKLDHDWTPPWTALYNREQSRGSGTSGFSTGSSTLDTTRSSVFTKASATSENTLDMDEYDDYKDDIIDLYCTSNDETLHSIEENDDQEDANTRRRSRMIAQAMEQSTDELSRHSSAQKSPVPHVPEEVDEVRLDHQTEHCPPRLAVKNTAHDQYGFRKASREITMDTYEAWWSEYAKVQKHRTSRWKEYMKASSLPAEDPRCFPEPSSKTRRFVQKGIPPAWRGNAWFFYAGGHQYLDRYPGRYQDLLVKAQEGKLSKLDKEAIERDLHRTFPDNIHFKPDQDSLSFSPDADDAHGDEAPMLAALRRVLSAFAIDHPKTGYCQSLNFLGGMLLLFLPEERAFWLLHIITTDLLPGTHETSLEGANVDLWVLMLAIRDTLPVIWQKVGQIPAETTGGGGGGGGSGSLETWQPDSVRLPPISLCTTSWFMSLFIGTLPTETVLRVWDCLFYDGAKTLFRVALAVFKAGEAEIKAIQDPMEVFQVVQTLPRRMIRCGELMTRATAGGKLALSGTWVDRQRAARKAFFAKERGVEVARKMSKVGAKGSKAGGGRSGKESATASPLDGATSLLPPPPPLTESPGLGEIPRLERAPTRKASGWFVRRRDTIRKTASPVT